MINAIHAKIKMKKKYAPPKGYQENLALLNTVKTFDIQDVRLAELLNGKQTKLLLGSSDVRIDIDRLLGYNEEFREVMFGGTEVNVTYQRKTTLQNCLENILANYEVVITPSSDGILLSTEDSVPKDYAFFYIPAPFPPQTWKFVLEFNDLAPETPADQQLYDNISIYRMKYKQHYDNIFAAIESVPGVDVDFGVRDGEMETGNIFMVIGSLETLDKVAKELTNKGIKFVRY